MSEGHDLVPEHGRHRAARHLVRRGVVVVAHPDGADEVPGKADEPGVAIAVCGAGLARRLDALEHGALAGAFLDHLVQHVVHVGDDARRKHLLGRLLLLRLIDEHERRIDPDGVVRLTGVQGRVHRRRYHHRVRDQGDGVQAERPFAVLGALGLDRKRDARVPFDVVHLLAPPEVS